MYLSSGRPRLTQAEKDCRCVTVTCIIYIGLDHLLASCAFQQNCPLTACATTVSATDGAWKEGSRKAMSLAKLLTQVRD